MLVAHGAMVLVIDGAKMSILRNRAKDFTADLEVVEHHEAPAAKTATTGADKPGRSFNSTGRSRSAYEGSDYHQVEEDVFGKAAIARLNALAQQSDLAFIIVAAPHVLGVIRPHYSANLRKQLSAEIDKDYAGRPAADVADLLRRHEV